MMASARAIRTKYVIHSNKYGFLNRVFKYRNYWIVYWDDNFFLFVDFKIFKKVMPLCSNKLVISLLILKLKIKILRCTKKMNVKKHASFINTIQFFLTFTCEITSFFICKIFFSTDLHNLTCQGHCCLTIRPSL